MDCYSNGFSEGKTGSPRQILKTAYSAGMIEDEESWLKALVSRNNVAKKCIPSLLHLISTLVYVKM